MFILDITNTCADPGLANILSIIKKALNIIQILGPIIAIVGIAISIIKLMSNPEDKKAKPALKNNLIALIFLFMIPFIINLTMKVIAESTDTFNLAECWVSAENANREINGDKYIPTNQKPASTSYYPNQDDYELGDEVKESTSNSPSSSQTQNANASSLIFVGDSRTVGMKSAVNSNDTWSCQSSMGLSWMKSTGIPNITSNLTNDSALIILMGVNDLYNANAYVSYINSNVDSWTASGAKVYFVSVNPTEDSANAPNSDIKEFNNKLKSNLSSKVKFINTYNYLESNGYSTTDGIHYTTDTYKKIYNYIKNNI